MGQAVEEGAGEGLIAEDLFPADKVQVRRDYHRAALVPPGAKGKQGLGALSTEWHKSKFVQDDEVIPGQGDFESAEPELRLGFQEVVEQAGDRVEADPFAIAAGSHAQADR